MDLRPLPMPAALALTLALSLPAGPVRSGPDGAPGAVPRAGEAPAAESPRVELRRDEQAGRLEVLVDGREALVYNYAGSLDLPHYWPLRSPTGESMTVQYPEQYPHHRSLWFADRVQLEGRRVADFYNAFHSREGAAGPFRDRVRHVKFLELEASGGRAAIQCLLSWELDREVPILEEERALCLTALGGGEYFLDVTFTLSAAHGEVTFLSDAVHYAWPYIRMDRRFSVEGGGRITSSEGGIDQAGTHDRVARWVDTSCTQGGVSAGLAIFSHPQNAHPHRWLTRDYGCFGPRREDARSGKRFTLRRGESIRQRVGVLVHRGGVEEGQVAPRYALYAAGKLGCSPPRAAPERPEASER